MPPTEQHRGRHARQRLRVDARSRTRRPLVGDQAPRDVDLCGGIGFGRGAEIVGGGVCGVEGGRPAERDRDRCRLSAVIDPQLTRDPVALDVVVEARRDDDEVRGEVALEPLAVLEGVVHLREGHRAGLEPAVEHLGHPPHHRPAARVVRVRPHELVDGGPVQVARAHAEASALGILPPALQSAQGGAGSIARSDPERTRARVVPYTFAFTGDFEPGEVGLLWSLSSLLLVLLLLVPCANIAILNYIADRFGAAGSLPRGDAYAAAKCNELLGWYASSVHIAFAQVWRMERFSDDKSIHPAIQQGGRAALEKQFAEIEVSIGDGWLVGDRFTAADSYALTFFRWGRRIGMDMGAYPKWAALNARLMAEPSVQRVVEREEIGTELFQPAA